MSERISHDHDLVDAAREQLVELTEQRERSSTTAASAFDIREKVLNAIIDGTPRDELVAELSAVTYSFPEYRTRASEARSPGTWNEVVMALVEGYLSDDEFRTVAKAAGPAARS